MYYLLGIVGNRDTPVKKPDTFWWEIGERNFINKKQINKYDYLD